MDRITILFFILTFTLFAYLFTNNKTEHLTSESNEALQTLSSLYTNQGTLVVPNLKVTGNATISNLTLTGSNSGSCGAKNICMSVAPEYTGNYGLYVSGNIQAENTVEAMNMKATNSVGATTFNAAGTGCMGCALTPGGSTNNIWISGTVSGAGGLASGASATVNDNLTVASATVNDNLYTTNFYVAGKQITSF